MERDQDYERLVEPIERQMIAAIWKIVRDPADFDDAFQEACIKVWKRLSRIRRHPNPHALILRICVNTAYDALRKRNRRWKAEERSRRAQCLPNPEGGPMQRERRERLIDAIGVLPRNQAQSILMRFMEGLSYDAIAQVLGCNESTVRTHVERGCRRLHLVLSDLEIP